MREEEEVEIGKARLARDVGTGEPSVDKLVL